MARAGENGGAASGAVDSALRSMSRLLDRNQAFRDDAVAEWAASIPPQSRVLDIGAGTCPYRSLFEGRCEYIAQDHPAVRYDETGIVRIRSDVTAIPLESGSVDAILCTEVLEHVEEPLRAIEEFARLLRAGGRLFLSVPAACRVHRVPTHYYGGFAPDFFERSMVSRGFDIERLRPVGSWSVFMAQELGRVPYILRHETALGGVAGRALSAAAWPMFRIAIPLALLAFSAVDRSTDLPLGWIAEATKR